jgi:hypothetical protein
LRQPTPQLSLAKPTTFPKKSRYDKGKGKVRNNSQEVPVTAGPFSIEGIADRGERLTIFDLLIGTRPSREVAIFSEECGSPAAVLLPDVLLPRVSSATVPFEHVIIGNPLELEHDEPMEAEPFASEDILPIEERRWDALLDSTDIEARESRKEGSTNNRVIIDTLRRPLGLQTVKLQN